MSGRQEWFDRCVDAVARVSPALAGRFVCPLCLTDFGSVDEVSQEHAPPHKLGGHRVAVTCRTCNHSAGHQLDDDMRAFESQVDLGQDTMTAPVRVKVEAGGAKITASVIRTGRRHQDGGHAERSNPKEHDALFSHLDTLVADGTSEGESITMTFLDRFAPTDVSAGWLRAGYLVAFAKLGYSYILRPELDPVRAQIANPTTEHAPRAVWFKRRCLQHVVASGWSRNRRRSRGSTSASGVGRSSCRVSAQEHTSKPRRVRTLATTERHGARQRHLLADSP